MHILLEYVFEHLSAEALYVHAAERLRQVGHRCRVVQSVARSRLDPGQFDVYVTHGVVPPDLRKRTRCFGGRGEDRPTLLGLLEGSGIPVAPWSRACDRAAVRDLFDQWSAELLLCKRSFTCGGEGVSAFGRDELQELSWQPEHDVFSPELDPETGDTYKAEIFAGRRIICWRATKPPLRRRGLVGAAVRIDRFHGERELFEPPDPLAKAVESLSETLTSRGYGYVSVDLMRARDGTFQVIELNSELVATWWTSRFPFVRARFADALVGAIGPAGRASRLLASIVGRLQRCRPHSRGAA